MIIILKMNPAEYGCKLQRFPTAPQVAKSQSDDVCGATGINCGVQPPESHNRYILIGCCLRECTSADVCLKWSHRYYMTIMPTIMLCCTVSITISDLLTFNREILLLFKISKRTNLDINDVACLHIVPNLQHPTYCATTKSKQTTMVNARKQNFSPVPAVRFGNSTKQSTEWHHHANEGKSALEAERARAQGVLCSLRSKKKLLLEKPRETHFLSHEEQEKWIGDDVER